VLDDARLLAALRRALADLDRAPEGLEADQVILDIAEALLALDPSARGRGSGARCAASIERAQHFLDENHRRAVASAELEAVAGLDRYTLARHFRSRLGTSPYRYLTMRRLDAVRRRLRCGEALADIAHASGFADQSHMTRQFKQAYGLSPGKWRAINVER
jgi:AraC-like DNA-binding protein